MGDKLGPVSETRHRLGVAAVDAESLRSTVEKIKNGLQQRRFDMPLGRIKLTRLVVECIELMLEVLDTTWSIMEEFRLKHEKEMNTVYDEHLGVMVDSIILKTKILHISVLLTTYDKTMVPALESLRNALEKQHQDVQAELSFANKQIEEYHSMGPEFRTLCSAYFDLLTMIQETEDDIRRINNA
ncbi:HAUS augmin-like complex subunit 4 [Phycomyces blakesleeanus]|uniref:HAUS augmin-like complex subunit 4 n=1 Tax=Phycomyces blakesleeanus TaxID=4837 RepID=A0ABR3AX67_PHYBL